MLPPAHRPEQAVAVASQEQVAPGLPRNLPEAAGLKPAVAVLDHRRSHPEEEGAIIRSQGHHDLPLSQPTVILEIQTEAVAAQVITAAAEVPGAAEDTAAEAVHAEAVVLAAAAEEAVAAVAAAAGDRRLKQFNGEGKD